MSALGAPMRRIEGREKVTGAARYAVEHPADGVLVGWPVQAPMPRGTVRSVDEGLPGAVAVLWHGNALALQAPEDPELAVLQSPRISYRGQVIALVVAETLEAARAGAQALRVELEPEPGHDAVLRFDHPEQYAPEEVNPSFPTDSVVGDVDAALAAASVTVDVTYETPAEFNHPMEPHATLARWEGGRLLVHDSTQGPSSVADDLAALFGLDDPKAVRVLAEHVGGGFGSKGSTRPNAVLAAMAARVTGRPVKVALPRQALFSMVGYRTPTLQRVQLGATPGGKLTAIAHDVVEQTSHLYEFAEQTATSTRHMYAAGDRRTTHRLVRLDLPTPRWMRAPGEAPGMFATEAAMDELALELGMDPVALRIANEPAVEPESGVPFTTRNLVGCLRAGAERFGWAGRDPRPGVRRDGRWLTGTGVASAIYPVNVMPTTGAVRLHPDGRWVASLAAADIGTGARTVLTQIVADAAGVPTDRVEVRLGDSDLAHASVAGGSSGTSSWGWALTRAVEQVQDKLADRAGVVPPGGLSGFGDIADVVAEREIDGKHAFGAHFAEVRVDADTGEVRATRMLGVFAAGRILNPQTARSQLLGGMVMGLGMALMEGGVLDPRTGDWTNHDLAEYHVPVSADVVGFEAHWLEEDDPDATRTASKGIGELGIVGSPAALVNAVWHATGVRVRDLPVRPDKLLGRGALTR